MRVLILTVFFVSVIQPSVARCQGLAKLLIKPSVSGEARESGLRILPNGDFIGRSVPVIELVNVAYDVPANPSPRLSSLPEWAAGRRFDIEAKASSSFHLLSDDAVRQTQEIQQFIQLLLADGFGLVLSAREERMPVYALVTGKTGVKLNKAHKSDCIFDTSPERCRSFAPGFGHPLNGRAVNMSELAHYLENWTDLPVVNRTAMIGLFDMQSPGWKPMVLPPPPPGAAASGDEFANLPSLLTVLERFGLELRRQEESVPLYTVERIREPSVK